MTRPWTAAPDWKGTPETCPQGGKLWFEMPANIDEFSLQELVGQKLLIAFRGRGQLPDALLAALKEYRPAGITLFRTLNIEAPAQVRRLTALLQAAARDLGLPTLIIAADQEGGQLMAVGEGVTQLPGNMALGAAGSLELARQAGAVLGRELAAMGINVDYAPSCDVNINPANPVIGIRSFGEDPAKVGALVAALVGGLQETGVAATAKHFPGHGDTASDSHHGVPVVAHSREVLESVDLPPFRAAVQAGARLVMTGHVAIPALDGRADRPATLSRLVMRDLLREELGFAGVAVSDAMDMRAIKQGEALGEEALRAVLAGIDLLLVTADPEDQRRVFTHLAEAAQEGVLPRGDLAASVGRVLALKEWIAAAPPQPGLEVVGCREHCAVADAIAAASMTLGRDRTGLLPLHLPPGQRIAVVLPHPADLTPADTSSYITPQLAGSLRRYHPDVVEINVSFAPEEAEIASALEQLRGADLVVVGTINAYAQPRQAELVRAVLGTGLPVVLAALRLPYDLAAFPEAPAAVCTYSILEPSMRALAASLFGKAGFPGQLPVSMPEG